MYIKEIIMLKKLTIIETKDHREKFLSSLTNFSGEFKKKQQPIKKRKKLKKLLS